MNLSEQLISAGFEPDTLFGSKFNPKNNWMGVSVYHPDVYFERGDKVVILSVQGALMPIPELTPENWELLQSRGARYVGFSINKVKVYQNWRGVLPDEEFIKEFIK